MCICNTSIIIINILLCFSFRNALFGLLLVAFCGLQSEFCGLRTEITVIVVILFCSKFSDSWFVHGLYFPQDKRAFMLISISYWTLDLLLAALAVFFYFHENIQPKGNREVFLTIGIGKCRNCVDELRKFIKIFLKYFPVYWTCSYIVSIIWYVKKPHLPGVGVMEELKFLNR